MKKKIVIVLSVILICLIGVIVWYNKNRRTPNP